MILAETIQDRLTKEEGKSICFDFDIRYLDKWIKKHPNCFPKYILNGNYTPIFNSDKYRWEILKGKREVKFNPQNYL